MYVIIKLKYRFVRKFQEKSLKKNVHIFLCSDMNDDMIKQIIQISNYQYVHFYMYTLRFWFHALHFN